MADGLKFLVDVRGPEKNPIWGFKRLSHVKVVGQVTVPIHVFSTSPIVVQARLLHEGGDASEVLSSPVER